MPVLQTPQMSPQFFDTTEADIQVGEQRARTDQNTATRRAIRNYNRILDQFQGGVAARGGFYSSARHKGAQNLATDLQETGDDINQAMHRQLQDFARRRSYAAMGIII